MDLAELSEQRVALQPDKIQAATSKLKAAYGKKFDLSMLLDSKMDVAELLGEEIEMRSVREDLRKKQEQTVEYKKASKKREQER